MIARSLAIALCCLTCVVSSVAQMRCIPGRGCFPAPAAAPQIVQTPPAYTWTRGSDGTQLLYDRGILKGCWDPADGRYWSFNGKVLQMIGERSPIAPPIVTGEIPTGVDWAKIDQGKEVIEMNGHRVTKDEAYEAFALPPDRLTDDSKFLRCTIYSPNTSAREKLRKELDQAVAFANWRSSMLVWDVPPDDWSVADIALPKGQEGVVLQAPDGKVLHHQGNLELQPLLVGLRKADPKRDPKIDPDASKEDPVFLSPELTKKYGPLGIVGCAGFLLWWSRFGSQRQRSS